MPMLSCCGSKGGYQEWKVGADLCQPKKRKKRLPDALYTSFTNCPVIRSINRKKLIEGKDKSQRHQDCRNFIIVKVCGYS